MERSTSGDAGFWGRLGLAWKVLWDADWARRLLAPPVGGGEKEETPPPERVHAPALHLLAALQREGRLVDFLQQDVAGFGDEEVGAAARVVHSGCRKVLQQCLELGTAWPGAEGESVRVGPGFDAQRVRLTGEVSGGAPYSGVLRHHGWVATAVRFPEVNRALDPRVLAPAEVEVGAKG
ncbi:MAG: DUF2760 domain-containing protein [Verrucomicrobiae bacterium]|nr:DUF2760 domain-containing protein [Verrucomicrobiae bacterium]